MVLVLFIQISFFNSDGHEAYETYMTQIIYIKELCTVIRITLVIISKNKNRKKILIWLHIYKTSLTYINCFKYFFASTFNTLYKQEGKWSYGIAISNKYGHTQNCSRFLMVVMIRSQTYLLSFIPIYVREWHTFISFIFQITHNYENTNPLILYQNTYHWS